MSSLFKKISTLKHQEKLALQCLVALSIAFVLCYFVNIPYLEYAAYDTLVQTNPIHKTSQKIQNLVIRGEEPRASSYSRVIKKVLKQKPKYVVFIFDPSEIKGSDSERKKLAKILEHKNIYYALNNLPLRGGEIIRPKPFDKLQIIIGPKTSDSRIFAKDKVTRRAVVSYLDQLSLHSYIAQQMQPNFNPLKARGIYKFYRTQQILIKFRPKGTYKPIEFSKLNKENKKSLSQKNLKNAFTNKIVFIGKDNLKSGQYVLTPYSKSPTALSTLELHANITDTLLLNNAPLQADPWVNYLITALLSVLVILGAMLLRPAHGFQIMIATLISFTFLTYILYLLFGYVLTVTQPVLTIFICYYLFIPYRLIMEYQVKWEYLEKNKLLTQMEELKSNFLRMMSHDLRTPLARIQGMANVARTSGELSDKQNQAIDSIYSSSEELIEFISSILSLTRIESKDLSLKMMSKDINQLLKSVIKKCDYLAQQKNIKIETDLEPLFSIKCDEDLLKQVFVNILENAIKYSKENSSVRVSSQEHDKKITITFADSGMGISKEEISNIFMKFFRSSKVSNIRGSGLGLYLSKYFIDLHNGKIFVESKPQVGSVFTVELPIK